MPTLMKSKRRRATKAELLETSSTLIGAAFTMPELALEALADQTPIDFQARQDSISETRRSPGAELAPKVKRTSAKPSKARETVIKLESTEQSG